MVKILPMRRWLSIRHPYTGITRIRFGGYDLSP